MSVKSITSENNRNISDEIPEVCITLRDKKVKKYVM
jgi:hypothetical protein